MTTLVWDKEADNQEERFYCIFCMKGLPVVDGVIIHEEDVDHPYWYTFDEENNPQ